PHAASDGACSARPYENDNGHGCGPERFISLRWIVELTSDWPPERKTTPATSAGTWSRRTRTVAAATSSGPACVGAPAPDSTMFTLRREPARLTRWAASCSYSASNVRAVAP